MSPHNIFAKLVLALASYVLALTCAAASPEKALEHVVSVLPVWPGHQQGGNGGRPGEVPEGSGVVVRENIIATAWHVVQPAQNIDVRLADGRILPVRLLAKDEASDIALLQIDQPLPPFELAPEPKIAQPVCAIGNAFGLGLSVTCGVVSAKGVSNAGFNAVEDFVQTDAAANPGSSGGALIDGKGRLIGMMSAIFAAKSDTNIGVNFAVSAALLVRVTDALLSTGKVAYPKPGWRLQTADRAQRSTLAAPVVRSVQSGSPANAAGMQPGDQVADIGSRRIHTPRDAVTALALVPESEDEVAIRLIRNAVEQTVTLSFGQSKPKQQTQQSLPSNPECPHRQDICEMRRAVFPVSSFDPIGSATRIAEDLLVTNRHVVGDFQETTVHTPSGPRQAVLVPSAYRGDLVLLKVAGLPDNGAIAELSAQDLRSADYYAIGADIARKQVRVFDPGGLIALPDEKAEFGRIHVAAEMQPGVSGGGLFDTNGKLVGIAVGGGEGRFEAIPADDIKELLELRDEDDAGNVTSRLGASLIACSEEIEAAEQAQQTAKNLTRLTDTCSLAANHGQLLNAGRVLAHAGQFESAIRLHTQATRQVPNSINSRMSLLVSLQLAGRFEEMTEHARSLMYLAPNDPQALRFSIQSGVWGGEPDLAEQGYKALLKADPRQAQAARRFIDNAPPAPLRR